MPTKSLAELGHPSGGGTETLQVGNIIESWEGDAPTGGILTWDAPAGGADYYEVELYRTKHLTDQINAGHTRQTTNSMTLTSSPLEVKSIKITAFLGGDSGYIIIEDVVKN